MQPPIHRSRRTEDNPREEKAMAEFRPTYITFDCYGTLIDFQMSTMTRMMFADRVNADHLQAFTTDFSAYRFDEVLGEWKPYGVCAILGEGRWWLPPHGITRRETPVTM